jgi:hypothetical protein
MPTAAPRLRLIRLKIKNPQGLDPEDCNPQLILTPPQPTRESPYDPEEVFWLRGPAERPPIYYPRLPIFRSDQLSAFSDQLAS